MLHQLDWPSSHTTLPCQSDDDHEALDRGEHTNDTVQAFLGMVAVHTHPPNVENEAGESEDEYGWCEQVAGMYLIFMFHSCHVVERYVCFVCSKPISRKNAVCFIQFSHTRYTPIMVSKNDCIGSFPIM